MKSKLEVYKCSGEEISADPRREQEYRKKVSEGLGFGKDWQEKRPYITAADRAVFVEVVERKAGGFWVPGTPRTTVMYVQHDTIPKGLPCRTPPLKLRGETQPMVAESLEEEVKRGQMERGSSPWGSLPFMTKEMPSHKTRRKRQLVIDYRRVNSRTLRAFYSEGFRRGWRCHG